MSRVSGVSCFQNVFDLLDYEPPLSPTALVAIEETEARIGRRLPAALRVRAAIATCPRTAAAAAPKSSVS